jgi:cytochrome b561
MTAEGTGLAHSRAKWAWPVQWLHWLSLLAILAVATMGLLMTDLPRGTPLRTLFYATHKSLGITVLALGLLRLLCRAFTHAPKPADGPRWQQRLASANHVLLYVLLLAMPLSGWLLNSTAGQPLKWFGLFPLPALTGKNADLRVWADTAHTWLFWTLAVLVSLHLLAALYHHWIRKDGLLGRMRPFGQRASSNGACDTHA